MVHRTACGTGIAMSRSLLLTVAILIIVVVALPLLSMLAGRKIRLTATGHFSKLWRYVRTMIILWSLTALALYALRLHGLYAVAVGVRAPRYPAELFLGLTWVVVMVVIASSAGRHYDADYRKAISAVVPATPSEWVLFVPLAATAGICEEFLYRGYALSMIYFFSGSLWTAGLLSSFAFALGHAYQGRPGMIGALFSGLFYAAVFVFTGSLLPCMLGHFAQDIVGAI